MAWSPASTTSSSRAATTSSACWRTLRRDATVWHAVRVRGRRKAEQFRASRVYPRLIADLLADLRAFGSQRAGAAA